MKEETRNQLKCDRCSGRGTVVAGTDESFCHSCQSSGLSRSKMKAKITELEAKLDALQHKGDVKPDKDFEPS